MFRKTIICTGAALLAASMPSASAAAPVATADPAVGAQYDTTHVYVPVADFDRFVASFSATFGGTTTKAIELKVTPTDSLTRSQLVLTPSGSVSVFGFKTPIPYPFGDERNGYLVRDMDGAVASALGNGAVRRIATFADPVGRDAVVQWPGGVNMQLYWHTKAPSYPALRSAPENRIHVTPEAAGPFVRAWTGFSRGKVLSDDRAASGAEVGRAGKTIRRIVIGSGFGPTIVLVSDGTLPWPFGREMTGYGVEDLDATLAKARTAGAEVVVPTFVAAGRHAAILRFPGGYLAEVHETGRR